MQVKRKRHFRNLQRAVAPVTKKFARTPCPRRQHPLGPKLLARDI
jgi:hypothetical protein